MFQEGVRTFYEQVEDKEKAFLAAFESAATGMRTRIASAVADAGPGWRQQLRDGIGALLRFIAEEPEAARTVIVAARSSAPTGLRRRDELLDRFAACIDDLVREELDEPPSAIAAAGVVGAIESVLYAHLREGETEELDALLPSLMYVAVLAYAGPDAADDELAGAALA